MDMYQSVPQFCLFFEHCCICIVVHLTGCVFFFFRCQDESVSKPKVQAIAKPYLVCKTPHLAEDQARCPKEEQTEVDPGEVLDIEINAPSGDEFQVSYPFISLDSIGFVVLFFFPSPP